MKASVRTLILFTVSLLLVMAASAQEDPDYEWKTWKTKRSLAGFNGHGGFIVRSFSIDTDLQTLTREWGLGAFPERMTTFGGHGMGHTGNGWRLGGGGFAGTERVDNLIPDSTGSMFNRRAELTYSGWGLIAEYAPWMINRVNFGFGWWLGFSTHTIKLHQDSGAFTWDQLTDPFNNAPGINEVSNFDVALTREAMFFQPYATFRVHILNWMALQGSYGFSVEFPISAWDFDEKEIAADGPKVDFSNSFFTVGIMFGG